MTFTLATNGILASYASSTESFGGLGKAGLITVIIVSVLLIVTVAWVLTNLKERD